MTAPDSTHPARPARWYFRVMPVTGLLLALLVLATLLFPPVREQVSLSLTRKQQPFVELYFERSVSDGGQAVCTRRGTAAVVRFVVASHLARAQGVIWRVVVDPSPAGVGTVRRAGVLSTVPGRATGHRLAVSLPRGAAYTVVVVLPANNRTIRASCPRGSS